MRPIIHVMANTGTYDFYFDICDKLEELGVEFSVTVAHETGIVVLSNVEKPLLASKMLAAQDKTFRERFNSGNPDSGLGH